MHALDDDDLLELTHELSALGGSTAKIGKCRAFCTDDAGPGEAAADGGPRFTLTEGPEGPQWYHDSVTGTEVCDAHDRTSIPAIAAAEAEWVVAGFNTTVLAFGQATPDKSRALYGAPVRPAAEAAPDSLCGCGVRALFQAAAARYPDKSWHVALSAFEVRPPVDEARPRTHCTVDLLAGVALQPPVDAAADKTRAVTQQYGDGDDGCFAPATPQQQLWGAVRFAALPRQMPVGRPRTCTSGARPGLHLTTRHRWTGALGRGFGGSTPSAAERLGQIFFRAFRQSKKSAPSGGGQTPP